MGGANPILKSKFLPLEIVLASVCHRHVTSVDAESVLFRRAGQVVVRRPRVPDKQVSWFGAYFLPLEALVGKPLHAGISEPVPFRVPRRDWCFPGHRFVELLAV